MKLHGASLLLKREIGCRYIETEPIILMKRASAAPMFVPDQEVK